MTKPHLVVTIVLVRETSWRPWPDRKTGPWKIEITTEIVNGRWELVGLSIQPIGLPAVLTTTVLKKLRLPDEFVQHQRQIGESYERLTAAGRGRLKVTVGDQEFAPAEAGRFLKSASSAGRPPGRPTHWTPAELARVAQVYRDAWSAHKHPTTAVASRFHLSASGAAKVVRLARAAELLPPTTQGKPGWAEIPAKPKSALRSKGTKR